MKTFSFLFFSFLLLTSCSKEDMQIAAFNPLNGKTAATAGGFGDGLGEFESMELPSSSSCNCNLIILSNRKSGGSSHYWFNRFERTKPDGSTGVIQFGGPNANQFYTVTNQPLAVPFTADPSEDFELKSIGVDNVDGNVYYDELYAEAFCLALPP